MAVKKMPKLAANPDLDDEEDEDEEDDEEDEGGKKKAKGGNALAAWAKKNLGK